MTNQQQQKQQHLQELTVARAELTGGDTPGLIYVRASRGAAFLVTPRADALRDVETKIRALQGGQQK
ncbi:hypothetical protein ACHAXT_008731 [Thalassiosira profunda]